MKRAARRNPETEAHKTLFRERHGEIGAAAAEGSRVPATFTLDACRHGGMTELEEAELTDGQGRALSAHKSRAYEGYAKRTMERALARREDDMRIGSQPHRTRREQNFGMKAQNEFRNAEAGSNGATK